MDDGFGGFRDFETDASDHFHTTEQPVVEFPPHSSKKASRENSPQIKDEVVQKSYQILQATTEFLNDHWWSY